jgi:hypothetical protein
MCDSGSCGGMNIRSIQALPRGGKSIETISTFTAAMVVAGLADNRGTRSTPCSRRAASAAAHCAYRCDLLVVHATIATPSAEREARLPSKRPRWRR